MPQDRLPGFEFPSDEGYVYIGARGSNNIAACQIKIGYSHKDPLGRVKRLRLRMLALMQGTLEDETALHQRFRSARIDREWFLPTPDLLVFIAEHAASTIDLLDAVA